MNLKFSPNIKSSNYYCTAALALSILLLKEVLRVSISYIISLIYSEVSNILLEVLNLFNVHICVRVHIAKTLNTNPGFRVNSIKFTFSYFNYIVYKNDSISSLLS